MSNHGDISRGVDYEDACRGCGGTRTEGACSLCHKECTPKPSKPRPNRWALSDEQLKARRIVCAAILHRDTEELICGARHHDCLHSVFRTRTAGEYEQGFIDQFNKFLTREEAWMVAHRQKQVVRRCGGDEKRLYSENLY